MDSNVTRINVTLRRESPVDSYLCTFRDTPNEILDPQDYIRYLYPGWVIIRIWIDGNPNNDAKRHETLSDDPEWYIGVYECDK